MKRIKKTKIIATLGPSSSSSERIEKLIKEGVDVLRINFSHSSHKEAGILIKEIRKLNQKLSTNTSILADLQGPKLRIGEIKSKVTLIVGNKIKIKTGKKFTGDDKMIFVNYQSLPSDIKIGEKILIDDGKIILKVLDSNTKDENEKRGSKFKHQKWNTGPKIKKSKMIVVFSKVKNSKTQKYHQQFKN